MSVKYPDIYTLTIKPNHSLWLMEVVLNVAKTMTSSLVVSKRLKLNINFHCFLFFLYVFIELYQTHSLKFINTKMLHAEILSDF